MTTKERLHRLVEELPEQEASSALQYISSRPGREFGNVLTAPYPSDVVATEQAIMRQQIARSLVSDLRTQSAVQAALLFGSSARGDAQEDSDIDLLVVVEDDVALSHLHSILRAARRVGGLRSVSVASHTWRSLDIVRHEDWSFAHHLKAEGLPLFDPDDTLLHRISPKWPSDTAISREMETRCADLDRYDDLSRFMGDYFLPLLSIYIAAKQIVILADARWGVLEFRRGEAFIAAQELYPSCADAIAHLRSLDSIYHLRTGRRHHVATPPLNDRRFVATSLQAVRELVDEMT